MPNYDLPKSKKNKIKFIRELLQGQTTIDSLKKDFEVTLYFERPDGSRISDNGQVFTAEEFKAIELRQRKPGDYWLTMNLNV